MSNGYPLSFLLKIMFFYDFSLPQVVVSLFMMCILFLPLSKQWRTLRLFHLPSSYVKFLHAVLQVLEKDLAIFGFFIALGRSTQSFLSANGVSAMDNQIEGIIRCPMLLEYLQLQRMKIISTQWSVLLTNILYACIVGC